jgi:hypothetical protein
MSHSFYFHTPSWGQPSGHLFLCIQTGFRAGPPLVTTSEVLVSLPQVPFEIMIYDIVLVNELPLFSDMSSDDGALTPSVF